MAGRRRVDSGRCTLRAGSSSAAIQRSSATVPPVWSALSNKRHRSSCEAAVLGELEARECQEIHQNPSNMEENAKHCQAKNDIKYPLCLER